MGSHAFETFKSREDLSDQELVLSEDYEAERERIEAGRELIADAIDAGVIGELGDGDAFSAYVSWAEHSDGQAAFSLTINRVVAPKPGPDAPAEEVAAPAADPTPDPEVAQPVDQLGGGADTSEVGGGTGTYGESSGSDGNAVAGEAT